MNHQKNSAVKEPKKTLKAIEALHRLVDQLRFFYPPEGRFHKSVLVDAVYVEDVLREYGVDKKVDHARFSSRFKHLFHKENKELKKEVKELKTELKERGEKIQELIEDKK